MMEIKTTREIISDAYLAQGLFWIKKDKLVFSNDEKWVGQEWVRVDDIKREFEEYFKIHFFLNKSQFHRLFPELSQSSKRLEYD